MLSTMNDKIRAARADGIMLADYQKNALHQAETTLARMVERANEEFVITRAAAIIATVQYNFHRASWRDALRMVDTIDRLNSELFGEDC